jgi:hypothetical protein
VELQAVLRPFYLKGYALLVLYCIATTAVSAEFEICETFTAHIGTPNTFSQNLTLIYFFHDSTVLQAATT